MTDRHPDDATLVAWVTGGLDDVTSMSFEAHVMACTLCATRLEQAARIEETMHEAAARMSPEPTSKGRPAAARRASKRASMPTGLALAASLVLGLGLPGRWLSIEGEWLGPAAIEYANANASVQATPLREAPTCAVPDEQGAELCDEPATTTNDFDFELEGALAMSMPEPDDGTNFCADDVEGAGLACGVTEPV